MSRAAAPLAQVQGVDSDARLAFVEFLLTSIDVQESSRRAVDWLVAHAPVTEAVVLVAEPLSSEMLLVAEHGVTSGAIMDFSLSREDGAHPLIQALHTPVPTYIEALPAHIRSPLESRSFHVMPLRADASENAHGLLLVAGRAELDAETHWLARTLGKQVSRLICLLYTSDAADE